MFRNAWNRLAGRWNSHSEQDSRLILIFSCDISPKGGKDIVAGASLADDLLLVEISRQLIKIGRNYSLRH